MCSRPKRRGECTISSRAAGSSRSQGPGIRFRPTPPRRSSGRYAHSWAPEPGRRAAMKCQGCQAENPAPAKFCEQCGIPLARACSNCGSQLSSGARFCAECGHPALPAAAPAVGGAASLQSYTPRHLAEKILMSKSALEGERKQVTVLFADLKGSMELLA